MIQCADLGVGAGPRTPFEWATDWLPLSDRFPEWKTPPSMIAPDGQPLSIRASVIDGRTVLNAENLKTPGFYSATSPEQPEGKPVIAVNLSREESNLTPVIEAEIPKHLGMDDTAVAHDLESLRSLIIEHRIGRTFGEHLLWVALVLIAVEFIYANILGRSKGITGERTKAQGASSPHIGTDFIKTASPAKDA